jgi:hypothetical protein
VWGGAGAIVLPINDNAGIAEELLPMLQAYDPDHIAVHAMTVADVALEDPTAIDRDIDMYEFSEDRDVIRALLFKRPIYGGTWDVLAAQADGWCSPFKGLRQETKTFDQTEIGILHRHDEPRAPAFPRFVMIRPIQSARPRSGEHCFCASQGPPGRQQRSKHLSQDQRTPALRHPRALTSTPAISTPTIQGCLVGRWAAQVSVPTPWWTVNRPPGS